MTAIDPITREIVCNALASAADEMAMALYRTAYSTIVRDCLDYSTSLCDAEGQMIAQGVTIPLHLGSVPFAMETLLAKYGDDVEEGDVFILNDPFEGGIAHPGHLHCPARLLGGPARGLCREHGPPPRSGRAACRGVRPATIRRSFRRGCASPGSSSTRRGEADEALFALIRANVRVPQMTIGDLRAQLAACHIGARAIGELIGPPTAPRHLCVLHHRSDRLYRAASAGRNRLLARRQPHLYRLYGQRWGGRAAGAFAGGRSPWRATSCGPTSPARIRR